MLFRSAKFQFSFKYKLLGFDDGAPGAMTQTLQFAFTQRSLWDYTIGLVPVILGGIAAFGQIVNLVRPGKGGPKPPEV